MTLLKSTLAGLAIAFTLVSCSVQQFAVNTNIEPFEKGGTLWGEKTSNDNPDKGSIEFRKDGDLHLLGINVKKSDVKRMVKELNASAYTIETKSNLIVQFVTFGMVDYKIVKVIKRES